MVDISFEFHEVEFPEFNEEKALSWMERILSFYDFDQVVLSYVLVDDEYLLDLNQRVFEHDYYTDIITLNYNEGNSLSGEMYISVDRVRENSSLAGVSPLQELLRVIVHGYLHLVGLDDGTEEGEAEMRREEDKLLKLYN